MQPLSTSLGGQWRGGRTTRGPTLEKRSTLYPVFPYRGARDVVLGSGPRAVSDLDTLRVATRVSAILSLQHDECLATQGIDYPQQVRYCRRIGLVMACCPLRDFDPADQRRGLPAAVREPPMTVQTMKKRSQPVSRLPVGDRATPGGGGWLPALALSLLAQGCAAPSSPPPTATLASPVIGYSGMTPLDATTYLVVHDFKNAGPRLGLLRVAGPSCPYPYRAVVGSSTPASSPRTRRNRSQPMRCPQSRASA